MRKDPTLRLTPNTHLNHARVMTALNELRNQLDPTVYVSTAIPQSLTAARARHRART